MKYYLLLLCVCAISFSLQAQTAQPEPFKDANTILVQTQDSSNMALQKLGEILVSQGYTIEKLDKQFNTLTTTPKGMSSLATNITVVVQAAASKSQNSLLTVKADYSFPTRQGPYTGRAAYSGSKAAANRTSFLELENAARAYPEGKISYTKR